MAQHGYRYLVTSSSAQLPPLRSVRYAVPMVTRAYCGTLRPGGGLASGWKEWEERYWGGEDLPVGQVGSGELRIMCGQRGPCCASLQKAESFRKNVRLRVGVESDNVYCSMA